MAKAKATAGAVEPQIKRIQIVAVAAERSKEELKYDADMPWKVTVGVKAKAKNGNLIAVGKRRACIRLAKALENGRIVLV